MGEVREVTLRNGRKWFVCTSDPVVLPGDTWGACLLASSADLSLAVAQAWATAAMSANCNWIAIAAPNGEAVHDHIDRIVEAEEAYDLTTTWYDEPARWAWSASW